MRKCTGVFYLAVPGAQPSLTKRYPTAHVMHICHAFVCRMMFCVTNFCQTKFDIPLLWCLATLPITKCSVVVGLQSRANVILSDHRLLIRTRLLNHSRTTLTAPLAQNLATATPAILTTAWPNGSRRHPGRHPGRHPQGTRTTRAILRKPKSPRQHPGQHLP